MSRTKRAAAGTLTSLLQFVVQIGLQLLLTPLVLRWAGQDTLGAYAIIIQVIGYIGLLDLGFSVAFSRFLAQSTGDPDSRHFSQVLSTGQTFLLGTNVLFAISAVGVAYAIAWLPGLSPGTANSAKLALVMLAVWTVVRTPLMVYPNALTASQDLAYRNIVATLANVVRLIASIASLRAGFGLAGLMLGNIVGEMFDIVACRLRFITVRPQVRVTWGFPDRKLLREMIRFGLRSSLIGVATRLVLFSDTIIVGTMFGAVSASVYYTTQLFGSLGTSLIFRLSDSAAPAVNQLLAQGQIARLGEIYLRIVRYTLLMALPFAVGLLALSQSTIALWVGQAQYAGNAMTIAIAAFVVFISVSHISSIFILATGQISGLSNFAISEGVANLGLSLLLGHWIGIQGVMIATAITHIPTLIYLQWRMRKDFGVTSHAFLSESVGPAIAATAFSSTVLLIYKSLSIPPTWGTITAVAACFIVVHCFSCAKFGLTANEFVWVKESARAKLLRRSHS